MVMEVLIYALILASSIPVGLILAWLCDDEVVYGKKWFKIILYVLCIGLIGVLLFYFNWSIVLSLVYMIIVTLISLIKTLKKRHVFKSH